MNWTDHIDALVEKGILVETAKFLHISGVRFRKDSLHLNFIETEFSALIEHAIIKRLLGWGLKVDYDPAFETYAILGYATLHLETLPAGGYVNNCDTLPEALAAALPLLKGTK